MLVKGKIGEEEKKHYVLSKDFKTFTYDYTLHHGGKHFYCYCLQTFITADVFNSHIKDGFKINVRQRIRMPTKGEYIKFKNYEKNKFTIYGKVKPLFMICANGESILVPEDNEEQNLNGS